MYEIMHEKRAKSEKCVLSNHSNSKWGSGNAIRPVKRSALHFRGSEEPLLPTLMTTYHSQAMSFSFSRPVG